MKVVRYWSLGFWVFGHMAITIELPTVWLLVGPLSDAFGHPVLSVVFTSFVIIGPIEELFKFAFGATENLQ
jgi:hypothetical protein